uniref:Uncharacterized protein n=1 Tax=Amphimedon queenslandica TaxID=400682 RepID=A0A1X7SYH7_AMPQE
YARLNDEIVEVYYQKGRIDKQLVNTFRKAVATYYCHMKGIQRKYNHWCTNYIERDTEENGFMDLCCFFYNHTVKENYNKTSEYTEDDLTKFPEKYQELIRRVRLKIEKVGTDSSYLVPTYINEPEENNDIGEVSSTLGEKYFINNYPKLNRDQSDDNCMFSRNLIRSTIKANEVLNDTTLLLSDVIMYRKDCDSYIMVYAL